MLIIIGLNKLTFSSTPTFLHPHRRACMRDKKAYGILLDYMRFNSINIDQCVFGYFNIGKNYHALWLFLILKYIERRYRIFILAAQEMIYSPRSKVLSSKTLSSPLVLYPIHSKTFPSSCFHYQSLFRWKISFVYGIYTEVFDCNETDTVVTRKK